MSIEDVELGSEFFTMDLMIDLETLGTHSNAPVISIGAVFFSSRGLGEDIYINLDLNEQFDMGHIPNPDTIKWWMEQEGAAKKVFKEQAVSIDEGLKMFSAFCDQTQGDIKPWGNGASFDITIMENLYLSKKQTVPWKFWNVMDLRTFKRFVYSGKDMPMKGVAHNALDDAKHQALTVIEGMKRR